MGSGGIGDDQGALPGAPGGPGNVFDSKRRGFVSDDYDNEGFLSDRKN